MRPRSATRSPWPVTEAVAARRVPSTPTARSTPTRSRRPGITWTFGYPFPRLAPDEAVDRIDMIHALAPGMQVLDAGIAGPPGHAGRHRPRRPVPVRPPRRRRHASGSRPPRPGRSPRCSTAASPAATRSASATRAPRGEAADRIAIVRAGAGPRSALMWLPPQEAEFYGERDVRLGRARARPLRRPARRPAAIACSRGARSGSSRPGARPRVAGPAPGPRRTAIRVAWRNAPAQRFDWVGI